MEALENLLVLVVRDANAGIPDRKGDSGSICCQNVNANRSTGIGKLDGVV